MLCHEHVNEMFGFLWISLTANSQKFVTLISKVGRDRIDPPSIHGSTGPLNTAQVQEGVYELLAGDGVLYREGVNAATKRRRTI